MGGLVPSQSKSSRSDQNTDKTKMNQAKSLKERKPPREIKKKPNSIPVLEMPDFPMEADSESPKWLEHLQKHGVVVVQGVLTEDEVDQSVAKYWQFLDNNYNFLLKKYPQRWQHGGHLISGDARTLHGPNWPVTKHGFSAKNYSNHSECAWFMRTRAGVRRCFEQIYKTGDLITSFDTIIAWRPWWLEEGGEDTWLPRTEGLHIDQNPIYKKGFHCIQGMLLLHDIDENIGGLEVIPDTANDECQEILAQRLPSAESGSDFLMVQSSAIMNDEQHFKGKNKLVKGRAGDFILWDSRTVHGGVVGPGYESAEEAGLPLDHFARLASTICMTPKARATDDVLEQRRNAFELGIGTSHWPYEFNAAMWGGYKDKMDDDSSAKLYKPVELTAEVRNLIG